MTKEKIAQGKKNRASGQAFELSVRKDLEKNGYVVSKWQNNIQDNKLVPSKHKFNPFTKVMSIGTGFPDFIAYRHYSEGDPNYNRKIISLLPWEIIGVEAKTNGYLDKTEKEKAGWLLKKHIFDSMFIASKSKDRRIVYKKIRLKEEDDTSQEDNVRRNTQNGNI